MRLLIGKPLRRETAVLCTLYVMTEILKRNMYFLIFRLSTTKVIYHKLTANIYPKIYHTIPSQDVQKAIYIKYGYSWKVMLKK